MPNSSSIREWKNRIISELHNDEYFLKVLDVSEEDREDLSYKRIFPFFYDPNVITDVNTYIMVEIDIVSNNRVKLYAYPVIKFYVLCHQNDMKLDLPGVSATKMDYLAELIDKKYNGAKGFGIGKLELRSNIAYNLNEKFRYRKLEFWGTDLNNGLCGE